MSLNDDLAQLAYEHEDLAEAIDGVLKPVSDAVSRMRWKGPHHDRVRTELGAITRTVDAVTGGLRERARLLRRAAVTIPDPMFAGQPVFVQLPELRDDLLRQRDELLKNLRRQLTPMGPAVSAVFAEHGVG
ncbi:hypothetical protein ACQP1K_05975 [Sphaerimonospora sp. CA-214678]|uniref:hypothetical protein n=1 Tax=Sphaerimonospora sp. CA-214678 TaxID=3240029 RepID=UPI003D8A7853